MTAEISILNRSGVALAADSAVTIGESKIYNTANKLFSLSKHHPVGIMIYGNAKFMEHPWEILIKSYRDLLGSKEKSKLYMYKKGFVAHLIKDKRLRNEIAENRIVYRTFSDIMNRIINDVQNIIESSWKETGSVMDESEVKKNLNKYIEDGITTLKQEHKTILSIKKDEFEERFKSIINDFAKEKILFSYDDSTTELMITLAYEAIRRDFFSKGYSGLVISGYGKDELFPSLYEFITEGFILGELKYKIGKTCEISIEEEGTTAAVIPFAQREMVYSFMNGIEPLLEDNIKTLLENIIVRYPDFIFERTNIKLDEKDVLELNKLGNDILNSAYYHINEYQQREHVSPVLGIVDFLPKEELAEMAEALINLTSFKRRVSIDAETVGGPIDVAVITKGDGLIWIKRKHYFESEFNHAFFQNYLRGEGNDSVNE